MMAYWIERFPLRRFAPVAALVALAAQAGTSVSASRWLIDAAYALILIAQFRLWDDLADRGHDRDRHPERVLARAADVHPFVVAALLLTAINLVSAWSIGGAVPAVMLLLLDVGVGAWYLCRSDVRTSLGDCVVLLKYPTFVLILGAPRVNAALLAAWAAATYAAACLFEAWHDASSPIGHLLRGGTAVRAPGAHS
jgi:hypothetical protein